MLKSFKRFRRDFSRMTKAEKANTIDLVLGLGFAVVMVTLGLIFCLI